jgi:hypothetical protein
MRPRKRNWPLAALLLALLLPLQGFAAVSGCPQSPAARALPHHAAAAHTHCAEHPAPDPGQGSTARHHGFCADCCMAAVAQTAPAWIAPRGETPQLFLPLPRSPLMIPLDRLDRPPRTT